LKVVEVISPSNIALVKYWGKRNEELNLPFNSSLSITLGYELSVRSRIVFREGEGEDKLRINGRIASAEEVSEYIGKVMNRVRQIYGRVYAEVDSFSSFPESAGMASSAAGVAAVVEGANEALHLGLSKREMSKLARLGSGSACRSVFGGYVVWWRGNREDGEDSYCEQVFPHDYLEDLVDVIPIFEESRKPLSSRRAMRRTVESSTLFKCRVEYAENEVIRAIQLIKNKDLEQLFDLIMRNSNNMHAVILDSWPPIFYLDHQSLKVMEEIYNLKGAAYTFDAGPNPHILTTKRNLEKVLNIIVDIGAKRTIVTKPGEGPYIVG